MPAGKDLNTAMAMFVTALRALENIPVMWFRIMLLTKDYNLGRRCRQQLVFEKHVLPARRIEHSD